MKESIILNLIGILVIISGAFLAARGYFVEKDSDISNRTALGFGNNEHFKAMLHQKYNEIVGFCLIILGSILQFISNILSSSCIINIDKRTLLITFFISTLVLNVAFVYMINRHITNRMDKITVRGYILSYEKNIKEVDKNKWL